MNYFKIYYYYCVLPKSFDQHCSANAFVNNNPIIEITVEFLIFFLILYILFIIFFFFLFFLTLKILLFYYYL